MGQYNKKVIEWTDQQDEALLNCYHSLGKNAHKRIVEIRCEIKTDKIRDVDLVDYLSGSLDILEGKS